MKAKMTARLTRTKLVKTGRPKDDILKDGFAEDSGFWDAVLGRVGKRMTRGGYMTADEWRTFSSPTGPWKHLKAIALRPAFWLTAKHGNTKGAPITRKWLCDHIVERPLAVPLFLVWIREETRAVNPLELWLTYWRLDRMVKGELRSTYSDGDLAKLFEEDTGLVRSADAVTQARENIARRIRKHGRA